MCVLLLVLSCPSCLKFISHMSGMCVLCAWAIIPVFVIGRAPFRNYELLSVKQATVISHRHEPWFYRLSLSTPFFSESSFLARR